MRRGAFILCIIVLLGWVCMASPVHAAVIDRGTGPDALSWSFTDDGVLTVSGSGHMADYSYSYDTGLTAPWGAYRQSIQKVIIEEGVLSIGEFAFARCTVLTEVQISSSVSVISANAFFYSDVLPELTLPQGVHTVENNAFNCCWDLETIIFLGDAPAMGESALATFSGVIRYPADRSGWDAVAGQSYGGSPNWLSEQDSTVAQGDFGNGVSWLLEVNDEEEYCLTVSGAGPIPDFGSNKDLPWYSYAQKIRHLTLEEGITSVGDNAFHSFTSLKELAVPEGVVTLGERAFYRCSSLEQLTLPQSLTYIGISAMYDCSSLKSITIPSGVTKIDYSAFDGCKSLASVRFAGSKPSMDYGIFSNLTLTVYYPANDPTWEVRWFYLYEGKLTWTPDAGDHMVSGKCGKNLQWRLDYDGTLTISGEGPMEDYPRYWYAPWSDYREHLKAVVVEPGVTHIGADAFSYLGGITQVTIADTVTSIGNSAFYRSGITSIDIPGSITSLGEYAFYHCDALTQVNLSEGIASVGENAFYGCASLEKVYISSTVRDLAPNAFTECYQLSRITVDENNPYYVCHDGMTVLSRDETRLILLSNGYTGAFAVPDTVESISPEALRGCKGVTSVTMGDNVTSIGERAFWGCDLLTELSLSPSLIRIPSEMVSYCLALRQLVIPESVVLADAGAFADTPALTLVLFLGDAPYAGSENLFHYGNEAVTAYRTAGAQGFGATWGGAPVAQWSYTVSGVTECGQFGQQILTDPVLGITATRTLTVPHRFTDWEVEAYPAANQTGTWLRRCENCSHTERRDIPAAVQLPVSHLNRDLQNYTVSANVVGDHLRKLPEGGYERVDVYGEVIAAERYDESFQFLSRIDIPREMPLFGGYYCDGNYNYLVFGQENPNEQEDVEVVRIVRYSLSWCRLDSGSLYGGNTTIPFKSGSVRMAHSGNMLYIRTSHQMYMSGDGLRHQANMTLILFTPIMELTHAYVEVESHPTGYVSHSFNQFVLIDGDDFVAADHGDGYPRAIAVYRNRGMAGDYRITTDVESAAALFMQGLIGENATGASIGGLEASSQAYIVAGNTIDQDNATSFQAQRNIFLSVIPKSSFASSSRKTVYLTDYLTHESIRVSTPHLVEIHDDRYLVMWTEDFVLKYAFVDGWGNWDGVTYTSDSDIGSCKPIVTGNRVVWYVTDSSTPEFCWIELSAPETVHSWHEHFEQGRTGTFLDMPTAAKTGRASVQLCGVCKDVAEVTLPVLNDENYTVIHDSTSCLELSATTIIWHSPEYGDVTFYYSTGYGPCDYRIQEQITPTVEKPGQLTLCCSLCADLRYLRLEPLSEEHYAVTVIIPATCQTPGTALYTWANLFYGEFTFTAELPKTEHSWGQWVETVAPDATNDGVNTRMCAACGETETEVVDNNIFTDVKKDRFEEAILWAYYNGITTGTGDGTTFSPENTCTRKQIVTFLWRAAGEPEPKSMENPFVDVKQDRFEKAILWAYYEGITTGTGDGTTFSPENTCTRKQIVTFLWRFHGEPAPESMENNFKDVKNDRFAAAILWAAEQGITTGTGDGTTFSPENPCTRKQIVTFLFRDLAQ